MKVTPRNHNGTIQLKFTVSGQRYSFNPIPRSQYANPHHIAIAWAIAAQIQAEVLKGEFDPTLNRYRHCQKKPVSKGEFDLEIWDAWVDSLTLSPATKADHYEMIRRMIGKGSEWLTESRIAPSTFNKRLGYLKSCGKWAVDQGLLSDNPFTSIKPRKAVKPEIKPFSQKEIQSIIQGFESVYPHYTLFVKFLFMTGMRTGEAIGLRWGNIDFERGEIGVRESLSVDRTGNGYKRTRKTPKSGESRYLTLTPALRELLLPFVCTPDDLVFKSSKGSHIDAGNFREDWKRVLRACGVPYRKPYTTRHTFISYAIEQGVPITGVAYLAGHKDTRMVMTTYGHMINRPSMPNPLSLE
jgi:integrase